MPRDHTSAPAPLPLARRVEHQRRAAARERLREAESLLAGIIQSAEVIAQGAIPDGYGSAPAIFLLVSLHTAQFDELAAFASELEDLEDSGDAEPTEADHGERDTCDDEPSVISGACTAGMEDWEGVEYGGNAKDRAIVAKARARYRAPPAPERVGALTYATVDPETKRAGEWVLSRRGGSR